MHSNNHKMVKVDLQCPFCGNCQVFKLMSFRKALSCPSCHQAVFLAYAGSQKGDLDEHGNYFHAYEPFNLKSINSEFREVFR